MLITPDFFAENQPLFVGGARTTTYVILEELFERGYHIEMPYWPQRTIRFTDAHGRARTIHGIMNWQTPALARMMSGNKYMSGIMAKEQGLPLFETVLYESAEQAANFWRRHDGACILKTVSGAGGKGVWTQFTSVEQYVEKAERYAQNDQLLLQVKSSARADVRLLFIGDALIAATVRRPGYLIGDGQSTVKQLMVAQNDIRQDINTRHHQTMVLALLTDEKIRNNFGVDSDHVPEKGVRLQVSLANIADGGLAEDFTENVHPDFIEAGRKMVAALKCPVLAVDFLCDDPSKSFADNRDNLLFLETNTSPGIDLHHYPHMGESRNVAGAYIDHVLAYSDA